MPRLAAKLRAHAFCAITRLAQTYVVSAREKIYVEGAGYGGARGPQRILIAKLDAHLGKSEVTYGPPPIDRLAEATSLRWIQLISAGVPAELCVPAKKQNVVGSSIRFWIMGRIGIRLSCEGRVCLLIVVCAYRLKPGLQLSTCLLSLPICRE